MDFWYRGCGWCIAAMPAIKAVAARYAGKPVSVLGINKDRNPDDAKFVVDKLGLNYTTIRGESIPELYEVSGFPTLLLVDQEGVVREVHVGYSENLEQTLVESVDKLLGASKP
jgi:thiol-disulfide isomerase/thioredoxin